MAYRRGRGQIGSALISGEPTCDEYAYKFAIIGNPTSGSFDLNVLINGVTEVITVDWNMTHDDFVDAIKTHSEFDDDEDTVVRDGPGGPGNSLSAFPNQSCFLVFTFEDDDKGPPGFTVSDSNNTLSGSFIVPYVYLDKCCIAF